MKTKNLLILTNSLVGGGAEKQLLLTVRGLLRCGVRLRIYCLSPITKDVRYDGLLSACRSEGAVFFVPERHYGVIRIMARAIWDSLVCSPCILWTWGFRAEFFRLVCPLLWFPHGILALRSASATEMARHAGLLWWGGWLTAGYIANSNRAIEILSQRLPAAKQKSSVVYNAIEPEFLEEHSPRVPSGAFRVAMLGNVRFRVKGYDFALQLAKAIRDGRLPVRVIVGGRKMEGEPNLQEEIEKQDVADVVEWVGSVSNVREFLLGCDAFLLLSRYEGTSNSMLEAMALGLPCVATAVGDVKDFAAQGAGISVVDIGDVDAVLRQLKAWMARPEEARELGRRNRQFCRRMFSEESMVAAAKLALFGQVHPPVN